MIKKISYYISEQTNPFINLAIEEYLLNSVENDECILYLWQNRQTVVIGKNQNAIRECKVEELEKDGGYLVRRLSGGGAVFHDLGNLNFTFLVRKDDYNVNKQLDVILRAVHGLNIAAEKTGRNDITIEGKKFSGNAFYTTGNRCYHHGTIMVDVDKMMMSKYLNVSTQKLESKGVKSVKSRVVNLSEFYRGITVSEVIEKLIEAFAEVFSLDPVRLASKSFEYKEINELTEKFSSWEWRIGRLATFTYNMEKKFEWGEVQMHLNVKDGIVDDVVIYTDAMDTRLSEDLCGILKDSVFSWPLLAEVIDKMKRNDIFYKTIIEDIKEMLLSGGRAND